MSVRNLKPRPPEKIASEFIRAHLGKRCFAPMTGTEREALERATLDYLAALDTVIEVDQIGCAGDWCTYDPPVRVRVIQTDNADVYHWDIGTGADDDYLDPYWNVELVAPHPSIPADAHLYVHAPRSYFLPHALHAPKGGR